MSVSSAEDWKTEPSTVALRAHLEANNGINGLDILDVKDVAKEKLDGSAVIAAAVKKAQDELGSNGRVLLRASGTEALVRVMVEAQSDNIATNIAQQLADVVKGELG